MAKYYITTPIYYTNDVPHIGHAYTTVAADVLARWHRLKEEDVFFVTGTDEHGKKIAMAAEKAGKEPKQFVDEIVSKFKEAWKVLNISYDDFIRTTEPRHIKIVQEFIRRVSKAGDIYKGMYEGWYCMPCESLWTDFQLGMGKCPSCGRDVEKIREETYFFRLGKYMDRLLESYKKNPDFIQPEFRKNEMINRLGQGLRDLSITRVSVDWAIPFPLDKNHTVYVWFDALVNYLSVIGYPAKHKKYWPADLHLIGKEILWFHSVIWPAMLFSAGVEPPKEVFAHGWLTIDGQKMSKSLGNVIDPVYLAKKYSADALRYFLLREIPFGEDGDFSEKVMVSRINGELVSDLGNLVNRVLTLAERFKGKMEGKDVLGKKLDFEKIDKLVEKLELHHAIEEIFSFVREVNKYISEKEPWRIKDEKELGNVLYNLLESLRVIAILIYPFMPQTAETICKQLGVRLGTFRNLKFGKFEGKPKKGELLFRKVE